MTYLLINNVFDPTLLNIHLTWQDERAAPSHAAFLTASPMHMITAAMIARYRTRTLA